MYQVIQINAKSYQNKMFQTTLFYVSLLLDVKLKIIFNLWSLICHVYFANCQNKVTENKLFSKVCLFATKV